MHLDPVLTWYVECPCRGYGAKKRQKPARHDPKVGVHLVSKGVD